MPARDKGGIGSDDSLPPGAKRGEVSASYADGGVMSRTDAVAHDPSAPVRRGHLPFADSAEGEES
jgi:hypothetical protein